MRDKKPTIKAKAIIAKISIKIGIKISSEEQSLTNQTERQHASTTIQPWLPIVKRVVRSSGQLAHHRAAARQISKKIPAPPHSPFLQRHCERPTFQAR